MLDNWGEPCSTVYVLLGIYLVAAVILPGSAVLYIYIYIYISLFITIYHIISHCHHLLICCLYKVPCVLCGCCIMASSHWLYLCTRLVPGDGRVRVAGKWCDL